MFGSSFIENADIPPVPQDGIDALRLCQNLAKQLKMEELRYLAMWKEAELYRKEFDETGSSEAYGRSTRLLREIMDDWPVPSLLAAAHIEMAKLQLWQPVPAGHDQTPLVKWLERAKSALDDHAHIRGPVQEWPELSPSI